MLLFDQDQGAEVEALDLGAGLHVIALDGSAEGIDEDLRRDGVIDEGVERVGGVGGGLGWEQGQDLGFDIEADFGCVGGAGGCVGVGFAGAGAVVVRVESGEAEELFDVGGDVGADELLVLSEGDGDGGECEVVGLAGEGGGVELVADEGALGLGGGDVAEVDAVVEGVGRAVGFAAGLRVVELIVPDEGDAVSRDAGVGLEGGAEVVEAALEGGQGVFGAKAATSTVGGDVEVVEISELGGVGGGGCAGFLQDGLEDVGAVGDDAIDVQREECAHRLGIVGGPGDDAEAGLLEFGDVDCGGRAEERGVLRGEHGGGSTVSLGVGAGGGHQAEEGIGGCGHRFSPKSHRVALANCDKGSGEHEHGKGEDWALEIGRSHRTSTVAE